MCPKWSLLFCFLAAWMLVSVSSTKKVCKPPKNALKVTADQLKGVWYLRMHVDYGAFDYNSKCDRFELKFTNSTSGTGNSTWTNTENGKSGSYVYRTTITGNGVVRLIPVDNPEDSLEWYIILINNNDLVTSSCFYEDGMFSRQWTAVSTRFSNTARTQAEDVLRQAGVSYKGSYFFNNSDKCDA